MVIIEGKNKNLARRFYAGLIDYAIFFILMGAYIFAVGEQTDSGSYQVTGLKSFVIPLIWTIYFPLCEALFGQTIGKRALSIYVVDSSGDFPTFFHCFIRRILDVFEIGTMGIPGMLCINYSPKNQRVGDMMAGTTVIRTEAICRFCNTELELTPREVMKDLFICPNCNQAN